MGGLATILGPLWAGGLTNNLYLMLGMMLALLTLITVSTRLQPALLQLQVSSVQETATPTCSLPSLGVTPT